MNNTALIFFKNRRKFKRHFNYPRHSMRLSSRSIIAILVILFVIIVDQLIKIEIKTTFSLYESVNVTEWFKLLFTENRGMAFGMQFIGTMILAIFRIFRHCVFCRRTHPLHQAQGTIRTDYLPGISYFGSSRKYHRQHVLRVNFQRKPALRYARRTRSVRTRLWFFFIR